MNDRFAWARFGDVNGGHDLIEASGIENELLSDLRWHTDLPPAAPSDWPAFFAGYSVGQHYVVQFTQPDTQASRSGMVATTLVAVGQDELGDVALSTLRQAAADDNTPVVPSHLGQHIDGLGAVLDLLTRSQQAFWIGASTFDKLVDQLWEILTPADRAALTFGALFTPTGNPYPVSSSATHGVYLVAAPLRSRFPGDLLVDATNPPAAGEPGVDILAGRTGIAAQLGIEAPSLRQWLQVAQVNRYYDPAGISNLDELRACANLVTLLAPEPGAGLPIKQRLGAMIIDSVAGAPFSHVRGIRTLKLADLGIQLSDAIEPWAAAVIENPERIDDLEAAVAELAEAPTDLLTIEVETSLAGEIAARGQAIIDYLGVALAADSRTVFAALASHLDPQWGDSMLASVSAISEREWTHEVALLAELPLVHASACPTDNPTDAFRAHLSISRHSDESCARLAARCSPRHIVAAAFDLDAAALIPFAAEAARRDAEALLPTQPANQRWLEIWARAVDGGADPWTWLQPGDAARAVVDALLDGNRSFAGVLSKLSEHEEFDLAKYPRRTEAWGAMQDPARSRLLRRTAIIMVLEDAVTEDVEPVLRNAILSTDVMAETAASDVAAAINALETLAFHAHSDAAQAVVEAADLGVDADRFADLVIRRGWAGAARHVTRNAHHRTDLASIENKCRRVVPLPWFDWIEAALGRRSRTDAVGVGKDTPPLTLDALIVTAIQVERKAVRKHLDDLESKRHKKVTLDVGNFEGAERTLHVGVIEVGQGNIHAASLTTMAVTGLQPEVVLMVGIAGGVKDVEIGDVVASSKLYWSESGKSETDHEAPRPDYGPVSPELIQVARSVAADETWYLRRLGEASTTEAPDAIVAPIVVGERVVASSRSSDAIRIKGTYSDAVAVAMEDVGVATAADLAGSRTLAIRAVSDLLDGKAAAEARGSKQLAASHAAAFAFELLARLEFSNSEQEVTVEDSVESGDFDR